MNLFGCRSPAEAGDGLDGRLRFERPALAPFARWGSKSRSSSRRTAGLSPERNDSELQKRYRSLIGSLMHAAVTCRPDVAFAVGALSRHLVHPTAIHIKAAEHAFQYLRSTADLRAAA